MITVKEVKDKMDAGLEALKRELSKIRTGRASLALLDGIKVNAYGSPMPIAQCAALTVPENNLIAIKPWDPKTLAAIEKAIRASDLGLTPANDGQVIRLTIPPLTGERRAELVKQVKKIGENYKVAARNVRRDTNDALKKLKKDKEISEDEASRLQDEIQKATDAAISAIDGIVAEKEKEVTAV